MVSYINVNKTIFLIVVPYLEYFLKLIRPMSINVIA